MDSIHFVSAIPYQQYEQGRTTLRGESTEVEQVDESMRWKAKEKLPIPFLIHYL